MSMNLCMTKTVEFGGKSYILSWDMKVLYELEEEFDVSLLSDEAERFFRDMSFRKISRIIYSSMYKNKNANGERYSFDEVMEILASGDALQFMAELNGMISGVSSELAGKGKGKGKNPTQG